MEMNDNWFGTYQFLDFLYAFYAIFISNVSFYGEIVKENTVTDKQTRYSYFLCISFPEISNYIICLSLLSHCTILFIFYQIEPSCWKTRPNCIIIDENCLNHIKCGCGMLCHHLHVNKIMMWHVRSSLKVFMLTWRWRGHIIIFLLTWQ